MRPFPLALLPRFFCFSSRYSSWLAFCSSSSFCTNEAAGEAFSSANLVASENAAADSLHHRPVAPDQQIKRRFVPAGREAPQQFGVVDPFRRPRDTDAAEVLQ